jgi:hypothetical protein
MERILYQLLWCGSLNATTTTMAFHVPIPERALNALFEISACTDFALIGSGSSQIFCPNLIEFEQVVVSKHL